MKSVILIFFLQITGEVVFNEIMYDPMPAIGLPEYEYLEFHNTGQQEIELEGWTLDTGHRQEVFPSCRIRPGGYLLLVYPGSSGLYPDADGPLELMSGRTLLSNQGELLCLYDQKGNLADWVFYAPDMHTESYYAEGGWSLERIDPARSCGGHENWSTSVSRKGGTPGSRNSVYRSNPDYVRPFLSDIYIRDSAHILVEFSEPMQAETVGDPARYIVGSGNNQAVLAEVLHPMNRKVILTMQTALEEGRIYELRLDGGMKDCAGLEILSGGFHRFGLPAPPEPNAVLISEILFDPMPGCAEFIELYHHGDQVMDLYDMRMAVRDPLTGMISGITTPADRSTLVFPQEYIVLSRAPESLQQYYTTGHDARYVEVRGLASNDDRSGAILVLDKWLGIMDELEYDVRMHHPLLANTTGISLERLSYELPARDRSNWHSASSLEGYATPGRENSHGPGNMGRNTEILVDPVVFSPDMDGENDICYIHYAFGYPGNIIGARVFDAKGRLIHIIAENQLAGTKGFMSWDGRDLAGRRARTGIYLILVQVFDMQGRIRRYKETCVLSPGR
jgi:hypothetical protein